MPRRISPVYSLDQNIAWRLDLLEQSEFTDRLSSTNNTRPHARLRQLNIAAPVATAVVDPTKDHDISATLSHQIDCAAGAIWVSGNALLCSCPDCDAPMTVRLWLGLADCWRCPTSIGLTEEQLEAAEKLQRVQNQTVANTKPKKPSLPAPPPSLITLPGQNAAPSPSASGPSTPLPTPPPNFHTPTRREPNLISGSTERELERLSRGSSVARAIRNGFRNMPAWLVSFIVHAVILAILAFIFLSDGSLLPKSITLSTFLNSDDKAGGDIRMENQENALQDDLAVYSNLAEGDEELRNVLQAANDDARQLQRDPLPISPLPDLSDVKKNITTDRGKLNSFAARDPRVRSEIVRKQGGTTITEAAVSRGLRWLASVQNQDGGWSLKGYTKHRRPNNPSDVMATSLALLPMLGAGQTHEYGVYKEVVSKGLAWLMEHQKDDGDFRYGEDSDGQFGMYGHGQATIVICEAYALTGDKAFLESAQKAIRFIENAQHSEGGWRYQPGEKGDTSVLGWMMMALQSAKASGGKIPVDESTLRLADYFLDQVTGRASFETRNRKVPVYRYQKGHKPTAAMTAEALLCRIYMGWTKDDPRLDSAVQWLLEDHPPVDRGRNSNLYYWYYATQVMHHYGGRRWNAWNEKMRTLLISTQSTSGRFPGSWPMNRFKRGREGGRIYTTSLAVCTLEVYYRHIPLFHQIELDR